MKTKRIFKRRTRQLRKQKRSLKQKNKTRRIRGGISGAAQAAKNSLKKAGISTILLGKAATNAANSGIRAASTLTAAGVILTDGAAESTKRSSIVIAKTAEEAPRTAGRLISLGFNVTNIALQLLEASATTTGKVLLRLVKVE
jgi:hypothetical protein